MPQTKKPKPHTKRAKLPAIPVRLWRWFAAWWQARWWHKALAVVVAICMLVTGSAFGIAQWYIFQNRDKPYQLGTTFISHYAKDLGVDPQTTLRAILTDLQPTQLRLVSYWDTIESTQGAYDFSDLDWQMKMAEQYNTKVSLALGLRQPRWPECHMPKWALEQPKTQWYPALKQFMTATINRYKDSPVLQSYQLENEYFLSVFGECKDFDRQRLIEEAALVKELDQKHTLIISRSNNAIGFPMNEPTPDEYGVSVYKRVWDKTLTKRYFEYPFPPWFYGFLAGGGKIITGKDMIIHELQAEAWTPDGYDIKTAPTEELYKSMNPKRLADRFTYAKDSGIKHIDLWGAEWWYAMKVKRNEPGLWNTAKAEYAKARQHNVELEK